MMKVFFGHDQRICADIDDIHSWSVIQ